MERQHSGSLLGEVLLAAGAVTIEQLDAALERQHASGGSLGQILIDTKTVDAVQVSRALRIQARLRGRQDDGRTYILVVDDDPEVDAVLRDILEGAGYRVGIAHDGIEALAALLGGDAAPPGLVLLDVGLPGSNGVEILSRLRSVEAGSDLPVVVVTGNPDWEADIRGRGLTISGFLTKPVNVAQLLQAVESAVASGRSGGRS